jgi:hypothetical protein
MYRVKETTQREYIGASHSHAFFAVVYLALPPPSAITATALIFLLSMYKNSLHIQAERRMGGGELNKSTTNKNGLFQYISFSGNTFNVELARWNKSSTFLSSMNL